MSPAQVLQRSYALIKQQLLDGIHVPGQRLEAARLADDIHASITPVRDVLNRLTGEGLVRARAGDGFYVPVMTEQDLRDLLHWNAQLLGLSFRHGTRPDDRGKTPEQGGAGLAERTAGLFLEIAAHAGNSEFLRAIGSANDRLHSIRHGEAAVLTEVEAECAALEEAWYRRDLAGLRDRLRSYHRRRHRLAGSLLKQAGAPRTEQ